MSTRTEDLNIAYLDGKHARIDFDNFLKKSHSEMLMAWYEQISNINKTPELYSEFIRGFHFK